MLLAPILTAATEDHHIMPSVPFCFWGEGRNNDPGWQAGLDSSSSFGDTTGRVGLHAWENGGAPFGDSLVCRFTTRFSPTVPVRSSLLLISTEK